MARKRLNKKFLILGLSPVVLVGLLLVAWKVLPNYIPQLRWFLHGKPEEHEVNAKALYAAGKYQESAGEWGQVIWLKGSPDALSCTALADCYMHLVYKDIENLRNAKQFYDRAIAIQPNYKPALQALLALYIDDATITPGGPGRTFKQWTAVQEAAEKILEVDPNDADAKKTKYRAVIMRFATGDDILPQQVDETIAALTEMSKQKPFDADTVFYVMQAIMQRGYGRLKANDRAGANEYFGQVLKLVDDSLAAHDDDLMMHYRAGQALNYLGSAERASNQMPKYLERMESELVKAFNMVQPGHPMYAEMKLYLGKQLESIGKKDGAEKIYRDLLKEHPDDSQARLALAEVLARNTATRGEAITLLETAPPIDSGKYPGIKAFLGRRLELISTFEMVDFKLDNLPIYKGKPEFPAKLQEIDDAYAKLTAQPGVSQSPLAMQAKGRIEIAKGEHLKAVQTLELALKGLPNAGLVIENPDAELRAKVMFFLAGSYMQTDQTGQAKKYLLDIVDDYPTLLPARLMLAQLLIKEGKMQEATEHVNELSKAYPDSSGVIRLKMLTLDKEKDKAQLADLYNKLPEANPQDINDKIQMALYLERKADAAKLLEGLVKSNPKDIDARVTLARVYNDMGNKAQALASMDQAMAMLPNNPSLKIIRAEIEGSDVKELQRDLIDKETDPFRKEMLLYEQAVINGKPDEATQHLQAAASLKPDDGRVLELLFNRALLQQNWTEAARYADLLGRQNRDMVDGLLFRVRLALAKGELDKAADMAGQVVQKMGDFAQSWLVLGQVQKAQRKYPEAIQSFENALQRQSQNLAALRELIDISYIMGDPGRARSYIDQARKMFPNHAQLREVELAHEMKYGDPEKVITPREQMLKQAIDSKNAENETQAWMALGNAYVVTARGKKTPQAARPFLEKARDTLSQAMAKFPDNRDFVELFTDAMIQLKTPAEAEKAIAAFGARPAWQGKPDATLLMASLYFRTSRPADQEKVLRDYLATAPTNVPIQIQLSLLLAQQGKIDDALKVLEINADNPDIRTQRIEIQINGHRVAEAEKELNTVLASMPTPTAVLLNRKAFIDMNTGRTTEAQQILDKVLEQNPGNAEALFYRASIWVVNKTNLPRAIQELTAVRDSGFKPLETRTVLSQAYHYSNDDASAIRELEDAVRLPSSGKAPRLRLLDYYAAAVPPQWNQAEHLLDEARNVPQLTNDADLMHAEALMWLRRKDTTKASDAIARAIKAAPNNINLVRTYLEILTQARDYRGLLTYTDRVIAADKKAQWWVYQYRGRAKKGLDDKGGAMDEFQAGIDVATANNDDNAVAMLIGSIVDEIGVEPAKGRILTRVTRGESRFQIMMSYLEQKGGNIPAAITYAEQVSTDASAKPEYVVSAQRLLGTLYLSSEPPDVAKAVATYRKLIDRDATDMLALNNLACTMILPNSGFTAKDALEYSTRAFRIVEQTGSVNPYIYDTQGQVLILNGRFQEGVALLQQAIDKEPIAEACYHLGEAYLAMPQPRTAEAQDSLKQALALLDAASKDNKALDADLKSRVEKALDRARQPAPPAAQ